MKAEQADRAAMTIPSALEQDAIRSNRISPLSLCCRIVIREKPVPTFSHNALGAAMFAIAAVLCDGGRALAANPDQRDRQPGAVGRTDYERRNSARRISA